MMHAIDTCIYAHGRFGNSYAASKSTQHSAHRVALSGIVEKQRGQSFVVTGPFSLFFIRLTDLT
ncbi:MAG TPA: hypothetical protein VEV81_07800, partial [Pyrinomonadaceae bacterium]|nr:hypothetical protein [Pyrinomonadaceae bacterium]